MADYEVSTTPGSKKPRFFYGYVVVVAAFFIMVIYAGALYSFGVFFKPLAAEFGWTRAVIAGAYSTCLFLTGLLYMVTGRLNDRFGPRVVITICSLISGTGYLLMSRIDAVWQLYLIYGVIVAVGLGGGFVPMVSTVARWFVKRRGLMMGIVLSGVGIGTVVMPPLVTHLIATYGWRTTYIIIGVITLVVLVVAAQFLKRDPGQVGQLAYGENELVEKELDLQSSGFSLQKAMHTRQFWILGAILFCFGLWQQTIMVHIVPHAIDIGISAVSAANILSVTGGISIASRVIMGSVADRTGSKRAIIIIFILMAAALFWLPVAKELWMLYLFAVVFGFSYGGESSVRPLMVADLFGLKAYGVIHGVVFIGFTIGGAIGTVVAGRIFDITDSYQLAFLALAALGVVGIILVSFLRLSGKGGINEAGRSA